MEKPIEFLEGKKSRMVSGRWCVQLNGDMEYDNGRYFIEGYRLKEDDWILQMASKGWIDWNEFMPAYLQALTNKGIGEVTIKISYR